MERGALNALMETARPRAVGRRREGAPAPDMVFRLADPSICKLSLVRDSREFFENADRSATDPIPSAAADLKA